MKLVFVHKQVEKGIVVDRQLLVLAAVGVFAAGWTARASDMQFGQPRIELHERVLTQKTGCC